jgi:hypothetical protein
MPAPTVSDNLCGLGFAGPTAKYMEDTFVHVVPPYADLSPFPVTSTDDTTQTLALWTQEVLDNAAAIAAIQTSGDINVIATGSSTPRSLPDRFADVFNVLDYGAVGDGVTDDTAAIQAGEDDRSAVGGVLFFPSGTYKHSGVDIDRELGGGWLGMPGCRFIPTANGVVMMDLTNAAISSINWRDFSIEGIFFDGDGKTGVYAIREVAPYHTTITGCDFSRLAYDGHFTGSDDGQQTGWINISDIQQNGQGSWHFSGYDDTKYIFGVHISDLMQQGTGVAVWEAESAMLFRRAVSVKLTNLSLASIDNGAIGIDLVGDCQGVSLANVGLSRPTIGIRAGPWTDGVLPGYVSMVNVDVDQPSISGMDVKGRFWHLRNVPVTNGATRSSTGPGIWIQSESHDIEMSGIYAAYMNHSGILVEAGATEIRMSSVTAVNNNQIAGANYEIDLGACSYNDVVLYGENTIGAAGVNATGQRVVNGVTSDTVSVNTGSVATGAWWSTSTCGARLGRPLTPRLFACSLARRAWAALCRQAMPWLGMLW